MTTAPSFPGAVHTLVVGAGFAGLAAALALLRDDPGSDVLVIERASEVGGTWRDNTYPGCACDVPTSLYSFSFFSSACWSHTFARQPEILRYLNSVVEELVSGPTRRMWRLSATTATASAEPAPNSVKNSPRVLLASLFAVDAHDSLADSLFDAGLSTVAV